MKGSPFSPAVLSLLIGSPGSRGCIEEIQRQILDYSTLLNDPLCPLEMRDLLALEMGQLVSALLLQSERIDCVCHPDGRG
jgi:hypothetical protein